MRPRRAETSEPACTKRKMLSMKRSTSWPSSSRKYSAIVRPDSATRMRAPGGSFIWPKTSIVLSMTPDSVISSHRSLPSRDRAHAIVAEVLLHLADEHLPVVLDGDRVVDLGQLVREDGFDDDALDLLDPPRVLLGLSGSHVSPFHTSAS